MSSDLHTQAARLAASAIAQKPALQTISALPWTASALDGQHTDTVATAGMARQLQAGLTSIVDFSVMQIEQLCRERMLLVELHKRQLAAWRRIALNAAEAAEIDRLDRVIDAETAIVTEALTIVSEICGSNTGHSPVKSPLELRLELQLSGGAEITLRRARHSYRQSIASQPRTRDRARR